VAEGRGGAPAPQVCTGEGAGGRQPSGIAFQPGYVYIGYTDCIVRYPYKSGDTQLQGKPGEIGGSAGRRQSLRAKRHVQQGWEEDVRDGRLRLEQQRRRDVRRAAISEYNPDGTGFRIFASGLRNPTALAWQPGTNTLWTSVNERDNLGDDLVPDYITSVKEGGFYGWPFSYIGNHYDPMHVGKMPNLVKTAIVPDVLIPAHSAALGMVFYTGDQFPSHYKNGAFVALHGSWNRSKANGYKVCLCRSRAGSQEHWKTSLPGFLRTMERRARSPRGDAPQAWRSPGTEPCSSLTTPGTGSGK